MITISLPLMLAFGLLWAMCWPPAPRSTDLSARFLRSCSTEAMNFCGTSFFATAPAKRSSSSTWTTRPSKPMVFRKDENSTRTTIATAICRCWPSSRAIRSACTTAQLTAARHARGASPLVECIRAERPNTVILLRADSGFSNTALIDLCNELGIYYLIGLA